MRISDNDRNEFIRRGWLLLFLLTIGLAGTGQQVFAQKTASQSLPDQIETMEESVFGTAHKKLPLSARVQMLEVQLLAGPGKGTLPARMKKLQDAARSRTAKLLPPLAAGMDSGLTAPAPAPPILSATGKQGSATNHKFSPDAPPPFAPPCFRPAAATKTQGTVTSTSILQEGVKQHDSGKQTDSQLAFQAVLAQDPNNIDALFNLGVLAEEEGKFSEALDYYRTVLRNNPEDTQAQQAIAELTEKLEQNKTPFSNPLRQPQPPKLLIGRANQSALASSQYQQRDSNLPVVNIRQQQRRQRARNFSRAALGTALIFGASAAGLHCPACQILRGF